MSDPLLEALARTLRSEPRNGPLWLHYAELLHGAGRRDEALAALRTACELPDARAAATRRLVPLLREAGQLDEALIRAEQALQQGEDPELRAELRRVEEARGAPPAPSDPSEPAVRSTRAARSAPEAPEASEREPAPRPAPVTGDDVAPEDWAAQFAWDDLVVRFADVVGLEEVKRQIELKIIAPYRQPEVYRAFGRQGGGGILLYGPPGCGKSFVARATAGELGARFVAVGIHDVLDKWWGQSEKAVHGLFEDARHATPTVLFFDEFDALGAARRGDSQFFKVLVDQFLQEMDGVSGRNEGVLLLAATNAPWSVDGAFRRPGRFDRVLFVPPPDPAARAELLRRRLARLPGGERVDVARLARDTDLFTGADLVHLCDLAAEEALERSLAAGQVHEVTAQHVDAALSRTRSSALEWLADARNHARYANEGRQYDDLIQFLKEKRRW